MSATYTNQPGTRDIDTVRFEIDDKDCTPETDAAISDEEIQYLIDNNNHILLAAAAAADAVAGKYSDSPASKKVGDLSITYDAGGIAATYTSLAKSLRRRAAVKVGSKVYAGGLSKADKKTQELDTDRVQPVFTMGQDDSDSRTEERGLIDY